MENTNIIQALLRLFDYASIKRFNLKGKSVNFEDEIGLKAISINNILKSTQGLDIFDENLKLEDLTKYEHFLGNALSNHVNKKIVLRKVNDEVIVLRKSKAVEIKTLREHIVEFSASLSDFIKGIKTIDSDNLLKTIIECQYLSILEREELSDNYFSQSEITINKTAYFLISILMHENVKKENLFITNMFLLEKSSYSKYNGNPIQLFLKGLDKYGIDMNINDTLSRYYNKIQVPLETNVKSTEFLKMQNIGTKEPFILSMILNQTLTSIILQNVFATRTNLILSEFNK